MHQIAKRGLALLMALIMCIGLLPVMNLRADAAEIEYVYDSTGKYIYNWGSRGETATSLSPKAEEFYTNTTYTELSQLSGGTSTSDAPDSALYSALQKLMKDAHTYVNAYSAANNLFQYTDCQNSGTDSKEISSFYSGNAIGPAWDSGATWNKEHTWPNSKGDKAGIGEDDIMMLRPTAKDENGSRGNKAYGESSGYYYPNTESNDKLDVRGDVARIVLYTYVRWGCINTGSSYNPNDIVGTAGVIESLKVLLDWIEADPVDTWELGRNDAVQQITGTRNVFVDYPELAFLLFGADMPANMPTPSGEAKNADTCQHNYVAGTPVAPTCTEKGYTVYTCSLCSKSYKGDKTPATGHTYVDGTCTGCGKTEPTSNAVLIYYPTDQKYVTGEEYLYNNKKYELVLSADKADALKLIKIENEDGTVTFATADGQYLMADGTNVRLVTAEGDNTKFVLETATNGYYIKCANATYNGKAQYLEVYGGYLTCFGFDSSKANIYTFQLEAVDGEVEICQHPNTEIIPGKDATCGEPGLTEGKKCTDCGATLTAQQEIPATDEHTYENGVCTGCGKKQPATGEKTVTVTIADYADANGWVNSTKYSTLIMDDMITVTVSGKDNTGKYYTSGEQWRVYQTENPSIAVTAAEGATIASVKITYVSEKTGVMTLNGNNVPSATVVEVNASSVIFGVGNTGSATNGQVRITAIEVVYVTETGETPCEHTNTEVLPGKDATCVEPGLTEGLKCSDCGAVLTEQEEIPATGEHTYVGGICTGCGKKQPATSEKTVTVTIADYADANGWVNSTKYSTLIMDDMITVTVSGKDNTGKYYTSGEQWRVYQTENPSIAVTAAEGATIASVKITYVSEKTGVMTLNGNNVPSATVVEVNASSVIFGVGNTGSATNGQVRITAIEVVYVGAAETPEPECQHTNTKVEGAVAATCTTDGHTGKTVCVDCGETISEGEAIPAGHTEETVSGKAATCTESGLTDGVKCSVCGEVLKEQEEIPAGHTEETVSGKDATCTEAGLTDGVKCSVCGVVLKEQEEIPATGHNYVDGICANCGEEDPRATRYNVHFVVPTGVNAVASATCGPKGIALPTAEAPAGFTFVGWALASVKDTQQLPDVVHYAGNELNVTADTVLYALYTYESTATNAVNSIYTVYATAETEQPVNKADFDTIVTANANGDSGYTKTYTTTNGWTTVNCAIQTGTSGSVSNPQFPVIGPDNTHKAVCLNGKTSAFGKVTSPTLTGGISKLTMDYTKMFTDTKLSVTITITDLATGQTYSQVVAREEAKDTKYVVWTYEWELETPITGDFTIEVVNNCPSSNSGNKDRFTILELAWVSAPQVETVPVTYYTTVIGDDCAHVATVVDAKAATCTVAGFTGNAYCAECKINVSTGCDTETIPHNEVSAADKPATCTEPGYTGKTVCADCGETLNEGEPVSATGHTPSEPVIEKEFAADCVNDGSYDSVVYCSVCKAEISREAVLVPATGHDYQAVVTAPTCSENGYTTYTCSVCGDSYVADEVPATGAHTFGAWNVLKAATCTEGGMRTRSCVCGASQTEMIAATGVHAYSAWTETKAATCTEEGEKTRSCACGINEFAKIAALGHTEVVDAAVAATCTTAGKTEGKHCDLCNEVLTAQEEIPALGHSEVTDAGKAATCTTAGKTEGKHCSVCGEVLVAQEVIAATGHSFGDWKVSKETTRTEAGEETRSCACGEMETREIPALGGVNPVPVVIVVVAGLGAVAVVAFVFMKKKRA